MFGKGTKIYGVVNMKCPRCHEGEIFPNRNPYDLKRLMEVNESCDKCGLKYEPEPNFFQGAMYVSFAYQVALFVASMIIGFVFLGLSATGVILLLVGLLVSLTPLMIRLSRSTWLHIIVKYRKDAIENFHQEHKH